MGDSRLIAHVVYRFGHGGLENGLVNLINNMYLKGYRERYRHAIVCITGYTDFRNRLLDDSVEIFSLEKKEGKDLSYYSRLVRLLRKLRPLIVHSRNLPALECSMIARVAGIPRIVHGEHGWDVHDLNGTVRRYRWIRRMSIPFVDRYVALSRHIEKWLCEDVGIPKKRIVRICNGVDIDKFRPERDCGTNDHVHIGYVGRLDPVKNPELLLKAYSKMLEVQPALRDRTTLHVIGDGSLRAIIEKRVSQPDLEGNVILYGVRDDVPELLRNLDLYVLPSLNEGISNSILEAMASGLPIVATDVGGNAELVLDGVNGCLVESNNPDAMAEAMLRYCVDPMIREQHAKVSRDRATQEFSIDKMVEKYVGLYDSLSHGMWQDGTRN